MKKKKFYSLFMLTIILLLITGFSPGKKDKAKANSPIYISFLWHMHQPIYWPYESIVQTQAAHRYSFSLFDIFNQRTGPYTSWVKDAIQKGIDAGLQHFGAQVSFSGSLIENLNNLEADGNGNFQSWKSSWNYIKNKKTSLGNPRLDMVGFGYFHPLMALIDYRDTRKQIEMHKAAFAINFPGPYSKGIFPPENAFSERMIPALVDEGFQWVLVDNIHFERACKNYPYSVNSNLYEPNEADQRNPDPDDWVQLNGLWAPSKVSAQWANQPHYAEYIDPSTGKISKIIVVPANRYMGNEDGRGGFGALNYDAVMSQLESYNTDPKHPILLVLAHDGDNYGGGSESYYHNNFQNFVNWLKSNPSRFVATTIQDYLNMFPPDRNDVIHVEDGSWSGADNGDPQFLKWNGNPGPDGYSPDRNSWGVITAAKNYVFTADQIDSLNTKTQNAWKYLLVGESSDYWYWDGSLNGIWDSNPTRAANQAVNLAKQVVKNGNDLTAPTIYLPQRKPYNPGATEWEIAQPSNFQVWSYVYDISGLKYVKLKYRTSLDTSNMKITTDDEIYSGGSTVSQWHEINMSSKYIQPRTNPLPVVKAKQFTAEITGIHNRLIDYYIEAEDNVGNVGKSPIRHVWVGSNSTGNPGGNHKVVWKPLDPTVNDSITIYVSGTAQSAKLHWGVNYNGSNWVQPDTAYWIPGTALFNGTGPAVETPFTGPVKDTLKIVIGPFNKKVQKVNSVAFVIHYADNTWDNNSGQDYHINFGSDTSSGGNGAAFVMDGLVDNSAKVVASNNGMNLYVGWNGRDLYVATKSASKVGQDVFIFVSDSLGDLTAAPWDKAGKVASNTFYLANESTNNYNAWANYKGEVQNFAGDFLEGTINVISQFGHLPANIFIAAVRYGTNNNGKLVLQVPQGNGDGNIDSTEFYDFNYKLPTDVKARQTILNAFKLMQNFPNPFNPTTTIIFKIAKTEFVKLILFDVLGKKIKTLVDEVKSPGSYSVTLDASSLSSGIYFYRLSAGNFNDVKKMILIK